MSRLIVKNLPKKITEERLRETFSTKGVITDLRLCYTKSGVFRKFCFVGYKTPQEAQSALKHFNKTFIDTSKIIVESAKDLCDNEAPRPWSKYSKGSSAHENWSKNKVERLQLIGELQQESEQSAKHTKKKKAKKIAKNETNSPENKPEELSSDEEFMEFMEAHQVKSKKKTWENETVEPSGRKAAKGDGKGKKETPFQFDDDDDDEDDTNDAHEMSSSSDEDQAGDAEQTVGKQTKAVKQDKLEDKLRSAVSDMDWLKSKVIKTKGETSPFGGSLTQDDDGEKQADDDADSSSSSDSEPETKEKKSTDTVDDDETTSYTSATIKMRGLPFKCKEKEIIEFFRPLRIVDIRMPLNEEEKPTGNAFVDFVSPADAQKAMKYNNDYMKGRYIELFSMPGLDAAGNDDAGKPWENRDDKCKEEEPISESGRLFLRNLSYLCTEEDLEQQFSKYGPLAEVFLPLDKKLNKTTGIGFVTYLMPEHAVKAFNDLDGTVFQGRMLHVLPAKAKDPGGGTYTIEGPSSSYKREKQKADKALSVSDHNWNALFLGQNAVAELMADRLNTTKSGILDAESSQSLAVRLALGETQAVSETREFLVSQGVKLDLFGQPTTKRSKSVILAKNLPHGTNAAELRDVFSQFGNIGRLVMPPAGITGIVEFINSQDAKKAFENLAYTKFKHVPLYLEWAPLELLEDRPAPEPEEPEEQKEESADAGSSEEDENLETEDGSVLFIKNINFDSSEKALKEVFKRCGKVESLTIAKKKNPRDGSKLLSMGYGFVEYRKKSYAQEALKTLQHVKVDGHQLELKVSQRQSLAPKSDKKHAETKKQKTTKILVRNVPFEASRKELLELFSTFGEIKTLRLPQKVSGTGSHRGFAFVDFLTKQDAKRAFKALCQSTHLYGRRLVLEWAENEESVDAVRIRTAKHFHAGPSAKRSRKDLLDDLEKPEVEG